MRFSSVRIVAAFLSFALVRVPTPIFGPFSPIFSHQMQPLVVATMAENALSVPDQWGNHVLSGRRQSSVSLAFRHLPHCAPVAMVEGTLPAENFKSTLFAIAQVRQQIEELRRRPIIRSEQISHQREIDGLKWNEIILKEKLFAILGEEVGPSEHRWMTSLAEKVVALIDPTTLALAGASAAIVNLSLGEMGYFVSQALGEAVMAAYRAESVREHTGRILKRDEVALFLNGDGPLPKELYRKASHTEESILKGGAFDFWFKEGLLAGIQDYISGLGGTQLTNPARAVKAGVLREQRKHGEYDQGALRSGGVIAMRPLSPRERVAKITELSSQISDFSLLALTKIQKEVLDLYQRGRSRSEISQERIVNSDTLVRAEENVIRKLSAHVQLLSALARGPESVLEADASWLALDSRAQRVVKTHWQKIKDVTNAAPKEVLGMSYSSPDVLLHLQLALYNLGLRNLPIFGKPGERGCFSDQNSTSLSRPLTTREKIRNLAYQIDPSWITWQKHERSIFDSSVQGRATQEILDAFSITQRTLYLRLPHILKKVVAAHHLMDAMGSGPKAVRALLVENLPLSPGAIHFLEKYRKRTVNDFIELTVDDFRGKPNATLATITEIANFSSRLRSINARRYSGALGKEVAEKVRQLNSEIYEGLKAGSESSTQLAQALAGLWDLLTKELAPTEAITSPGHEPIAKLLPGSAKMNDESDADFAIRLLLTQAYIGLQSALAEDNPTAIQKIHDRIYGVLNFGLIRSIVPFSMKRITPADTARIQMESFFLPEAVESSVGEIRQGETRSLGAQIIHRQGTLNSWPDLIVPLTDQGEIIPGAVANSKGDGRYEFQSHLAGASLFDFGFWYADASLDATPTRSHRRSNAGVEDDSITGLLLSNILFAGFLAILVKALALVPGPTTYSVVFLSPIFMRFLRVFKLQFFPVSENCPFPNSQVAVTKSA